MMRPSGPMKLIFKGKVFELKYEHVLTATPEQTRPLLNGVKQIASKIWTFIDQNLPGERGSEVELSLKIWWMFSTFCRRIASFSESFACLTLLATSSSDLHNTF